MTTLPSWAVAVFVAAMVVIPALLPERVFRKWLETPWQTERRLDLTYRLQRKWLVKRNPDLDSILPRSRPDQRWPTLRGHPCDKKQPPG